ncbi:hypothetical protein EDB89DRAFT_1917649 [Lactarius sanguifluus]|nr:hypothetical protein EDB89DRAFT_1917649 [Lactarius sanguifluus]
MATGGTAPDVALAGTTTIPATGATTTGALPTGALPTGAPATGTAPPATGTGANATPTNPGDQARSIFVNGILLTERTLMPDSTWPTDLILDRSKSNWEDWNLHLSYVHQQTLGHSRNSYSDDVTVIW